MDEAIRPAEVFPPSEFLKEELASRTWTTFDLAAGLGWGLQQTTDLLEGRVQLDRALASRLAEVFGTSPELWLNLQQEYLRWSSGN